MNLHLTGLTTRTVDRLQEGRVVEAGTPTLVTNPSIQANLILTPDDNSDLKGISAIHLALDVKTAELPELGFVQMEAWLREVLKKML